MRQDAKQIAAAAAQGFKLFQCEECADAVQRALIKDGFAGERIELRAKDDFELMICFSYDGGIGAVTQNGRHIGIRVRDAVFDNLHPNGISYDEWLRDFDAPAGVIVVRVDNF